MTYNVLMGTLNPTHSSLSSRYPHPQSSGLWRSQLGDKEGTVSSLYIKSRTSRPEMFFSRSRVQLLATALLGSDQGWWVKPPG